MLLTSVIIVLREVLEAALLVSILSAMSVSSGIGRQWVVWALFSGMLAALFMSQEINVISDWFEGVGQEVTSAGMQLTIYAAMAVFVWLIQPESRSGIVQSVPLKLLMSLIVGLSVAREGFEILIYLFGFTANLQQFLVILVGSVIGACIGISAGVLIYYLLRGLRQPWPHRVSLMLLVLVSAGLASQVALLLIQADWLPAHLPVWDSSALIAEDSVPGQLLYALIGYEATPSALQAGFYFGGGTIILVLAVLSSYRNRRLAGQ